MIVLDLLEDRRRHRQCSFFEWRWASVRVPFRATVPLSAVVLNFVLVAISDVYDYSLRV